MVIIECYCYMYSTTYTFIWYWYLWQCNDQIMFIYIVNPELCSESLVSYKFKIKRQTFQIRTQWPTQKSDFLQSRSRYSNKLPTQSRLVTPFCQSWLMTYGYPIQEVWFRRTASQRPCFVSKLAFLRDFGSSKFAE